MKTKKVILCFVALATMIFTACDNGGNKGNDDNDNKTNVANTTKDNSASNTLAGTTWQLSSPNDPTYHGDVIHTLTFGKGNEITYTRDFDFGDGNTSKDVMTGTYTFSDNKGVAMIHKEGETTDYRETFTVSGDELVWKFSLKEITLKKQ